jgi:hypothetical protein
VRTAASCGERVELALLVGVQVGGIAQEPAGGLPDRRRSRWGCRGPEPGSPGTDVLPDGGAAPAVAEVAEFLAEVLGVGASFGPALAEVGVVSPQGLGALASADVDQEFLGAVGAGEPADGVAGQVKLAGDRLDAVAVGQQRVDGGMSLAGADRDPVVPVGGRPGLRRQ